MFIICWWSTGHFDIKLRKKEQAQYHSFYFPRRLWYSTSTINAIVATSCTTAYAAQARWQAKKAKRSIRLFPHQLDPSTSGPGTPNRESIPQPTSGQVQTGPYLQQTPRTSVCEREKRDTTASKWHDRSQSSLYYNVDDNKNHQLQTIRITPQPTERNIRSFLYTSIHVRQA